MSHNTLRAPDGAVFRSNHEVYDEGDSVEITDPSGARIILSVTDCKALAHWLIHYDMSVKLEDVR